MADYTVTLKVPVRVMGVKNAAEAKKRAKWLMNQLAENGDVFQQVYDTWVSFRIGVLDAQERKPK